jgi:hypothetical protein
VNGREIVETNKYEYRNKDYPGTAKAVLHGEDYTAPKLGCKRRIAFSANSNNQSHNFARRSATDHSNTH